MFAGRPIEVLRLRIAERNLFISTMRVGKGQGKLRERLRVSVRVSVVWVSGLVLG